MSSKYEHLDRDSLVRLLERRDAERQLGLVWERDEIEADKAINDDFVALQIDSALSHGEAPWRNLIIEGDNFDALRALRMSHKGAIRCIYIDPPYNTGNRDFVYNDRFVDKTHRFRHSLWLEFMYRRLLLARELLAEDGAIFVSIDDNELYRLGMLMDRVFGERNRLAAFTWQTDGNFDNQAKIKISHEYVLAYAKDVSSFPVPSAVDPNVSNQSKLFREEIRNTIVKNGPKNPVTELVIPQGFPAAFADGVIPARTGNGWPKLDSEIVVKDHRTANSAVLRSGWANRGLCEQFIQNKFSPILDTKGQSTRFELTASGTIENVKTRSASHVVSVLRGLGSTQADSAKLSEMGIDFSYPKPVQLLQYLLSMVKGSDALVLDFFAGAGTTAHAVARLNAEDGGNRRFILVSSTEATEDQPDKNLCRDVCAERVRRVLGGYTSSKGVAVAGLGGGFAYLRARRIAPHRLAQKIDHGEVWTALLLLHDLPLQPWAKRQFDAAQGIAYLADFQPAAIEALAAWLAAAGEQARAMYSWSPARLQTLLSWPRHVDCLPLPQQLRERFGR